MKADEILKLVEWYASRRVDHFRLATLETSHDLRVALGAIKDAVDAALSQAEANRVDAERLTWVSENLVGVRETMVSEIEIVYFDAKGAKQIARGLTLRAAIDAARLTNAVKTKG